VRVIYVDADREALREICRLSGGNRSVAARAKVNDGNLGKWLRGNDKTLSTKSVLRVLDAIGLPDGKPREDIVHEWEFTVHIPRFKKAVGLFFPDGAEVGRAPWSKWGVGAIYRQMTLASLRLDAKQPEIYALFDGKPGWSSGGPPDTR